MDPVPDLPDLPGDQGIVADNIRAVQAAWFAHQLEGMRFFEVGEHLAEVFRQGLLPLGRGAAGRRLAAQLATRGGLTASARQQGVARTLGLPAGDAAPPTNAEFAELWLRFISSVSACERQNADGLLRHNAAASLSRRAVWQSARVLAQRLSSWGAAGPHFAAQDLAREVNRLRDLLQSPALAAAFGARDMWGVIDRVARAELGGAVDVARRRARAVAGSSLLQWLADHADALQRHAEPPADAAAPDPALHQAVAQWLALAAAEAVPRPALSAGTATRTVAKAKLRQIAGKYIGETEKNIGVLFDHVKDAGAVLLFDEADALFSRRTEVKDAHDRYADVVASPPPPPPPAPAPSGAKSAQLPSTRRISRP